MEIYLDTNMLYEYFGREKMGNSCNDRINQLRLQNILNNNTIKVSSVAIVEMLTNPCLSYIVKQEIVKFVVNKNLIVKNHAIFAFDHDFFKKYIDSGETQCKLMTKEILHKKILIEAIIGTVLCALTLQVYFDFYFERELSRNKALNDFDEAGIAEIKSLVQKTVLNDRREEMFTIDQKKIYKILRRGYASKTRENSAIKDSRKAFNDFLAKHLCRLTVYAENMISSYLGQPFIEDVAEAFYENMEVKELLKNENHIVKSVSRNLKLFKKEFSIDFIIKNNQKYLHYLKKFDKMNNWQAEYAFELITSWIQNGTKIEKNDTLDFLVLGGLSDEIILTLDGDLLDYLEKVNHKSVELINRIKVNIN